jgi:hypothetical protein
MPKFLANEKWKKVDLEHELHNNYAVSNYGRLLSYTKKFDDGTILKAGKVEGYPIFRYKKKGPRKVKHFHHFIHKLVAEGFVKKTSPKHNSVIHLDFKKDNNKASNLKWVTRAEMLSHTRKNPAVIAAKKKLVEYNRNAPGKKLTEAKVKQLKKKIFSPHRKTNLKDIAIQFNISEMQLYRIKNGKNWGHVKI